MWLVVSPREKVVKFLQSNPVQIVLCVIVLLDAVIVIAQILLDLNSVKRLYTPHTLLTLCGQCCRTPVRYVGWRFGVLVSVVDRINEVNQHRARLVP